MSPSHPTSPLQIPRFLRFWCGRISAATGNQMMMVAMGWQMYNLTGSAWDLGLVGLAQFLPALVLTLPAGHAADRGNRGLILVLCMVVETIVCGVLAVAAFGGWADRELLLAMSVALGAVKGFQNPAQQSMVALLVPDRLISRATAVSSMGMKAAVIVGPALGGAIYIAGEGVVYAVCAALFALAGGVFLALRKVHVPPPEEEVTLATVFAGFRFVWNHKPAVALRYRWQGSATFARLDAFARGIHAGLERVLEHGLPMILVGDGDIGGLVGIHFREELNLANAIVSIDGITLKEFDFIDIGAMLELSGAVPVVIKSLVFPASAALGRAV